MAATICRHLNNNDALDRSKKRGNKTSVLESWLAPSATVPVISTLQSKGTKPRVLELLLVLGLDPKDVGTLQVVRPCNFQNRTPGSR